jgi:hypothetical protein
MRTSPTRLFATFLLLSAAILTIGPAGAIAAKPPKVTKPTRPAATRPTTRPTAAYSDNPICYAEITGKGRINLDKLCGVDRKSNLIDLNIDADGDGVPDQLLAVMKTFNKAMGSAKTPQEYEAALQNMESRLPYSDRVRQLQAQQKNLQKQIGTVSNETQGQAIYRQLDSLQQEIFKDPSYTKVQEAMSKVYSKL